ncbi:hypothetical protein BJ508DRAFT_419533 [Ascobolus immersus RN42]|uniref:Uncharacterized protein n=1 Tax=Ascobolus immersus RN42 TaxID=1160509 RepID=A0A3N4HK68_ASCIM|nr:hypothetical protein BJ508DRAFT_419533 [Ascobolus immersus RN42]
MDTPSTAEHERLVEYGQIATPWLVRSRSVLGGKIVPKSWAFRSGALFPVEFGFNPGKLSPSTSRFPEIRLTQAFVTELYELLMREGLQNILGLTTIEDSEATLSSGKVINVERTIGRVSIMLPGSIRSQTSLEVSWSFGCSKAVSDSRLFAAKICWVCDDCEEAEDGLLEARF